MKVGIFGGGAIAIHLEKFLKEKTGYDIVVYPRNKIDVTNSKSVDNIIRDESFDWLFSLAALSNINDSFNNPKEYYKTNSDSTLNILNAVRLYSPQTKTIFAGSVHELINLSPYGGSKICSSNIVENFRNSYNLFAAQPKLSNVLVGRPNDNQFVVPKIVNYFKNGQFSKPLELGNVFSTKKWIDIFDVCSALWATATQETPFDGIISGEKEYSIKNLVEIAAPAVGIYGSWEILSDNHVYMDKTKVYVINNPLAARSNDPVIEYDIEETKKVLGWEPKISVDDSIRKLILE